MYLNPHQINNTPNYHLPIYQQLTIRLILFVLNSGVFNTRSDVI